MTALLSPVLEEGLRSPYFFNGRLVSAEDLTREHDATIERLARLGRAVGDGVACGLWVKAVPDTDKTKPPVLTVEAGLAVNRCGQTIHLAEQTSVTLVRGRPSSEASAAAGQFSCCVPLKMAPQRTGDGVYVLTIAPATGRQGRAAVNGLSPESARCNSRYLVEGAQFNLIAIGEPFLTDDDFSAVNLPYLRNRVAYKCFGLEELAGFTRDPFGSGLKEYGLMDKLRKAKQLSDCEVPLAVIQWTGLNNIEFVDMWAVRRRTVSCDNLVGLAPPVADRRLSEGEARFLQFQGQLESIGMERIDVSSVRARDRFNYLPAVGMLPLSDSRHPRGFEPLHFFSGITVREKTSFIEGSRLGSLIRSSLSFAPIELASREMLWLYQVRENQQLVDRGGTASPQPILVFASGHIAYQGDAHFDISHWSYATYS